MARSRNIKPAFFTNEILAECSPQARLAFIGLWTLADREGKVEDRPKRIKAQLFPFDDVDIDGILNELASARDVDGSPAFLARYEADGGRYIAIRNFREHQSPHIKEAKSKLPNPPPEIWVHQTSTVQAPDKHGASTRQAPLESVPLTPESLLLNPESPTPPPDSGDPGYSPVIPRAREADPDDPEPIGAIIGRMAGRAAS